MWDRYTKGRFQFILYDFTKDDYDPKFKIGFTLEKSATLYAAHDIMDNSSYKELREVIEKYGLKFSQFNKKFPL